jgi:hypothetical protein
LPVPELATSFPSNFFPTFVAACLDLFVPHTIQFPENLADDTEEDCFLLNTILPEPLLERDYFFYFNDNGSCDLFSCFDDSFIVFDYPEGLDVTLDHPYYVTASMFYYFLPILFPSVE